MSWICVLELNSRNKTTTHNSFVIPILIPAVGILEWNIKEIEDIDKKTRKILCIDRLYVERKDGGRGLKSFEDSFCTHIVGLAKHLERDRYQNHLLQNVFDHEQQRIIRLGKEYEKMYQPEQEEEKNNVCDKTLTKRISNETCKKRKKSGMRRLNTVIFFGNAMRTRTLTRTLPTPGLQRESCHLI